MPTAAFVAVIVPMLGLAWCWTTGRVLTAGDPRIALFAHVLALLVPVLWAYFFFLEPDVYLPSDERTLARRDSLGDGWWSIAVPSATPVLALAFLALAAVHAFAPGAQPERSGPGEVLLWWLLSIPVLLFWGGGLRMTPVLRVGAEGIRVGNVHFAEWERLVGYARRGSRFDLFHDANPHFPLSRVRLEDESEAALLLEQLRAHRVPEVRGHVAFALAQVCTAIAGCVLLALGYGVSVLYAVPRAWVLAAVFAAGVAAVAALDRHRGLAKVTTVGPIMEPADKTDVG